MYISCRKCPLSLVRVDIHLARVLSRSCVPGTCYGIPGSWSWHTVGRATLLVGCSSWIYQSPERRRGLTEAEITDQIWECRPSCTRSTDSGDFPAAFSYGYHDELYVVGHDQLRSATVCQRASAPSRLLMPGTWHEQSAFSSTGAQFTGCPALSHVVYMYTFYLCFWFLLVCCICGCTGPIYIFYVSYRSIAVQRCSGLSR